LTYAEPSAWTSFQDSHTKPTWSMNIIAVWNKHACTHLHETCPDGLAMLRHDIPEATWKIDHTGSSVDPECRIRVKVRVKLN